MATSIMMISLAATQVAGGVAGLTAGQRQGDFQDDLARVAIEDRRRQAKRLLARQRVAFAKGGVDPNTGSPVDLAADTAAEEELSALRAGFAFETRGDAFRQQGRNALIGGISSAATSAVLYPTLSNSILGPLRPKPVNVPGGITRNPSPVTAQPRPLRKP